MFVFGSFGCCPCLNFEGGGAFVLTVFRFGTILKRIQINIKKIKKQGYHTFTIGHSPPSNAFCSSLIICERYSFSPPLVKVTQCPYLSYSFIVITFILTSINNTNNVLLVRPTSTELCSL